MCPDHVHMLVSIPLYLSVAQFVGYLKSKSALMIFDRHANLKYKSDQISIEEYVDPFIEKEVGKK